ncbi:hypothetical protein GF361_02265 [Candidatus Woesearchaeota archaeon]|nr:hypothetical protein [Candidatus Woesearchaeota archaeon]
MNKKIAMLIAVFVVGILPLVLADTSDHAYTASVGTASNIIITELDTSFSNCAVASSCDQITDSLNIQNTGNTAPSTGISAAFTSDVGGVYGLVDATNVIPGTNFQINSVALTANTSTTEVVAVGSLGAGADLNVSADLSIPGGQASGSYNGTVQLSWTA